jgi:hypothetical protein
MGTSISRNPVGSNLGYHTWERQFEKPVDFSNRSLTPYLYHQPQSLPCVAAAHHAKLHTCALCTFVQFLFLFSFFPLLP